MQQVACGGGGGMVLVGSLKKSVFIFTVEIIKK